jgi:hypothetical protein
MAGKIYVSKVNGLADYDGGQVQLVAGITRVREGHPLLKNRESVFEEITVDYEVETARQAPEAEAKPEAKVEEPKTEPEPEPEAKPASKAAAPRRGPRRN